MTTGSLVCSSIQQSFYQLLAEYINDRNVGIRISDYDKKKKIDKLTNNKQFCLLVRI